VSYFPLFSQSHTGTPVLFIEQPETLFDAPDGKPLKGRLDFYIGTSAMLLEQSGSWSKVKTMYFTGWAPSHKISKVSEFKVLNKWPHKAIIEVLAGDYCGTYMVNQDGSFTLEELNDLDAPKISHRGRMYFFKNFLWAKIPGKPFSSFRVFIQTQKCGLLWQPDVQQMQSCLVP
jgi:hypothetical protein